MTSVYRDRNLVAAICYLPILAVVVSIVILFAEKEDKFIRFHAVQALIFSVSYYILVFFLGGLPYIGSFVSGLLFVVALAVWIFGMINAYGGRIFKLPIIGDFSERRLRGD